MSSLPYVVPIISNFARFSTTVDKSHVGLLNELNLVSVV